MSLRAERSSAASRSAKEATTPPPSPEAWRARLTRTSRTRRARLAHRLCLSAPWMVVRRAAEARARAARAKTQPPRQQRAHVPALHQLAGHGGVRVEASSAAADSASLLACVAKLAMRRPRSSPNSRDSWRTPSAPTGATPSAPPLCTSPPRAPGAWSANGLYARICACQGS